MKKSSFVCPTCGRVNYNPEVIKTGRCPWEKFHPSGYHPDDSIQKQRKAEVPR